MALPHFVFQGGETYASLEVVMQELKDSGLFDESIELDDVQS